MRASNQTKVHVSTPGMALDRTKYNSHGTKWHDQTVYEELGKTPVMSPIGFIKSALKLIRLQFGFNFVNFYFFLYEVP